MQTHQNALNNYYASMEL